MKLSIYKYEYIFLSLLRFTELSFKNECNLMDKVPLTAGYHRNITTA